MQFGDMLEKAKELHGHGSACIGLILGTRIAAEGLRRLGIEDPSKVHNLIVYAEIDRCMIDAIQAVTGCTFGKRRLKYVDYGKFAATFIDVSDDKAVRVSLRNNAKELARSFCEEQGLVERGIDLTQERETKLMAEAYSKMPDTDLLVVKKVHVQVPEMDLPGRPKRRVICHLCGEQVLDGREIAKDNQILCKSCSEGAYYRILQDKKEK